MLGVANFRPWTFSLRTGWKTCATDDNNFSE